MVKKIYGGAIMRERISKVLVKLRKQNWAILAFNALALVMVIQNVNAACVFTDHQPEVPEVAQRFKKIN